MDLLDYQKNDQGIFERKGEWSGIENRHEANLLVRTVARSNHQYELWSHGTLVHTYPMVRSCTEFRVDKISDQIGVSFLTTKGDTIDSIALSPYFAKQLGEALIAKALELETGPDEHNNAEIQN